MPFVPTPNIVQIEIRMELGGQFIENRVMIDVLETPTEQIVTAVVGQVGTWVEEVYALQLPDAVRFREVYGKGLDSENGFEHSRPFVGLTGQITGVPLPNHVTICASLRSGSIGRSARGRLYWPCLTEDQVTGNTVSEATLTSFSVALNELLSRMSDNMWAWVVVSYRHNNAPRVGGPVYFVIRNVIFTDNTVDSQRRRLPKRGR